MADAEMLVRRLVELTRRRAEALARSDWEEAVAIGAERSRVIEVLLAPGALEGLSPEAVRLIEEVVAADREALRQVQAEVLRVREELKRVRQARGALRRYMPRPDDEGGYERRA